MPPTLAHRFGPFEFDPASGRLFRGTVRVPLSDPQSAILLHLIAKAGQVVSKDALADAGWRSVAVTENSLMQSISRLRKALGSEQTGQVFIETIPNRGYRFVATVERTERLHADALPDAELAPYRAFVQGRADLHTLNRDAIWRARDAFDAALRLDPDYAPAHVGLANACALTFEATRVDAVCDCDALQLAIRHARRGTTLLPSSGEAWSTLAFALFLTGETGESAAAACKAIALEPDDWRHSLRLAYVSWGEERVRAARRVLALCPGLALAHWLIATVLIARGAFDAALGVLEDGCRAQDGQPTTPGSFPAVGLHLLRGLVLAAQHRLDEATRELTRELSFVDGGQLYARECAANTWYALGAMRLRAGAGRAGEAGGVGGEGAVGGAGKASWVSRANEAFATALSIAPGHLFAAAALGRTVPAVDVSAVAHSAKADPRSLDAALAGAVGLARAGRHCDAAKAYRDVVARAPLPCAGWVLPVEPLIDPASHPDIWADTLALVRQRAM